MVTLLPPEGAHFFSDWLDIYKGLPYIKPKRVLLCSLKMPVFRSGSRKCFMAVRLEVYRKSIRCGRLL